MRGRSFVGGTLEVRYISYDMSVVYSEPGKCTLQEILLKQIPAIKSCTVYTCKCVLGSC